MVLVVSKVPYTWQALSIYKAIEELSVGSKGLSYFMFTYTCKFDDGPSYY